MKARLIVLLMALFLSSQNSMAWVRGPTEITWRGGWIISFVPGSVFFVVPGEWVRTNRPDRRGERSIPWYERHREKTRLKTGLRPIRTAFR